MIFFIMPSLNSFSLFPSLFFLSPYNLSSSVASLFCISFLSLSNIFTFSTEPSSLYETSCFKPLSFNDSAILSIFSCISLSFSIDLSDNTEKLFGFLASISREPTYSTIKVTEPSSFIPILCFM